MNERTYTAAEHETLLNAAVAAALREADRRMEDVDADGDLSVAYGLAVAGVIVRAMIDQPGTTALNALIGAVIDGLAREFSIIDFPMQDEAHKATGLPTVAEMIVSRLHTLHPDALAALEAVKAQERERVLARFEAFADTLINAITAQFIRDEAAAIRKGDTE